MCPKNNARPINFRSHDIPVPVSIYKLSISRLIRTVPPSARQHWHRPISEKSRPKEHVHSSKVQLNFRHHCLKAFSMTSLSILFNLNLKYCINNYSQQTTSQRRNNYIIIMWLHEMLSLAATLLPHEYFPTCWKACNYCSVLHAKIACNNCTWNHGLNCSFFRGRMGREFRRVPDPGTRSLLPGRIRVVAGSGYVTCDVWHCFFCVVPPAV